MTPKRVLVRQLNSRRHGMARLLCGPWMPPQGSFQAQDAAGSECVTTWRTCAAQRGHVWLPLCVQVA